MDPKVCMHTGQLYHPGDESLQREQLKCLDKLYEFNQARPSDLERKRTLLREMFAEIGEGCCIEAPLHANWGGRFVHFGRNVYANFNLTLVDDTHIHVGDFTQFGPNVVLATAGHPICPELRERGFQYNAPIRIGRNCWLGAGVVVVPGVTIGDNVVVGAGSVVTRDLPDNVVAVGNPCKILREADGRDREYYFQNQTIDPSLL
ncbi:MAG: sugar O-acetyltransferase [Lawsonibacter sp.]|jgi:galactoside O-acetyltransferase|nr:sugar O-acetyltransferase [Lawsonibacter sp.]